MFGQRSLMLNRKSFYGYNTPDIERDLIINSSIQQRRKSLIWGVLNTLFLGFFLYDLSYKCPIYTTWFNYLEYSAVTIFGLNSLYHFFRYIFFTLKTDSLVRIASKERKEFKDSESDASVKSIYTGVFNPKMSSVKTNNNTNVDSQLLRSHGQQITQLTSTPKQTTFEASLRCTPLNWSAVSWGSQGSQHESSNMSVTSPSWTYHNGSFDQKAVSNSSPKSPNWIYYSGSEQKSTTNIPPPKYLHTSGVEHIVDEKLLQTYLDDYEHYEKASNMSNPSEQNCNLLTNFWNHQSTQNPNDMSPYLRKNQYQLSSQATISATNLSGKPDEIRTSLNVASLGTEVWRKLQIDPETLTQWNANLRMWISQTILDRLVHEITAVNEEFNKFHLNDVRIGNVGLERLRKTAQTMPVVQYIPSLATLLPFLEISPNQEYLVKRIAELAKGGCMSEFKWNSGGSYNGKDWDDSLVNDSEIVIHLLSTYLDCQLVPLATQPDAKPFSKEHFIRAAEKIPYSPLTLAIHQMTEKPPHFRLIIGDEVFEIAKGHNNLFYTVLLFLYFVNRKEHGMLGKVNMGRSGVNMLWIIE